MSPLKLRMLATRSGVSLSPPCRDPASRQEASLGRDSHTSFFRWKKGKKMAFSLRSLFHSFLFPQRNPEGAPPDVPCCQVPVALPQPQSPATASCVHGQGLSKNSSHGPRPEHVPFSFNYSAHLLNENLPFQSSGGEHEQPR